MASGVRCSAGDPSQPENPVTATALASAVAPTSGCALNTRYSRLKNY